MLWVRTFYAVEIRTISVVEREQKSSLLHHNMLRQDELNSKRLRVLILSKFGSTPCNMILRSPPAVTN